MKRVSLMIAAFVASVAMVNAAEMKTSDISGYDNVIYGVDETVGTDKTAVMSVCMKNSWSVPGFQFNLEVPEGFEVMTDDDGYYLIELSTERTTSRKTDIFRTSLQSDGSIMVLCSSTENAFFSGNDGEVCTIKFKMKEDLEIGNYEVGFKEIYISDAQGTTAYVERTTACLEVDAATGAELVGVDALEGAEIYGVDGTRRSGLQQGVNVIRYANGITRKVLVK